MRIERTKVEQRKIEGKDYTIIDTPRYKIPLAIPTGIYNILERIASNSTISFKEMKERSEPYRKALEAAKAEDAKLTPEARQKRDEERRQEKEKESLEQQEETLRAIGKLRANEEATRRKYEERL